MRRSASSHVMKGRLSSILAKSRPVPGNSSARSRWRRAQFQAVLKLIISFLMVAEEGWRFGLSGGSAFGGRGFLNFRFGLSASFSRRAFLYTLGSIHSSDRLSTYF